MSSNIQAMSGTYGVTQMQNDPGINTRGMTIQQQQQAHMVGPTSEQSPHQEVRQVVNIVNPGQDETQIPAPSSPQSQTGASASVGWPILVGVSEEKFCLKIFRGQMTTAGAPSTEPLDLEKCRLIHQPMMLFWHAYKCLKHEAESMNSENVQRQCQVPNCKIMRDLLIHMINCLDNKNCTVSECKMMRENIRHWENCATRTNYNCVVCNVLRQAASGRVDMPAEPPDLEKCRLIQQPMMLFWHAHKCQMLEAKSMNSENVQRQCQVPNCKIMRDLLTHMTTCRRDNKNCTVSECKMMRENIRHWKNCAIRTNLNCVVCNVLRQAASRGVDTPDQMFTAGAPSTKPPDTEKLNIRQRLVLLLHAHKCRKCESMNSENVQGQCQVPNCKMMKDLLTHMMTCQVARNCTVSNCSISRQIINHWGNCANSNCPICEPIISTANRRVDILYLQALRKFFDQNKFGQSIVIDIENRLANLQLSSGLQLNQVTATPMQGINEWRQSVTLDIRNHLIHKLVHASMPNPQTSLDVHDIQIRRLIADARMVEDFLYGIATSRSEYYHLLSEKAYKVQKEMVEKRQKEEQQLQAQQQQQQLQPTGASQNEDMRTS